MSDDNGDRNYTVKKGDYMKEMLRNDDSSSLLPTLIHNGKAKLIKQ